MKCSGLLERCGGHAKAAGLSIMGCRLEEFHTAINKLADEILTESDLVPQIELDAELTIDDVTRDLATELQLLEPYGYGNREPVFASRGAMIVDKNRMGNGGAHLKLRLAANCTRPVECVAFGWGESERAFRVGGLADLCYNIRLNQFNGAETVQLVLRDAQASVSAICDSPESTLV
jgi:single-stranded-DNA-specific exonuclease